MESDFGEGAMQKQIQKIRRSESGITGLETAIILIAFVVVASVFSFTVLTSGIFGAEKSKEAVSASFDEVRSSMTLKGNTIAYTGAVDNDGAPTTTTDRQDAAVRVDFTIGVALNGSPIDVTPAYQLDTASKFLETSGSTNTLVIQYIDATQTIDDMAWTIAFTGSNDGDFSLEPTEKAVITVWLQNLSWDANVPVDGLFYRTGTDSTDPFIDATGGLLQRFDVFSVQLTPVLGTPLFIEKIIPQSLNPIMNLR